MVVLPRTRVAACLVTLALLLALALDAPFADAASSWAVPAEPVAASVALSDSPVVAMDEAGATTELWVQRIGESSTVLESSTRPRGGVWTAPEPVPGSTFALEPAISATPAGEDSAVWRTDEGESSQIFASLRSSGGSWSAGAPLDTPVAHQYVYAPSIATSEDDAVAVWSVYNTEIGQEWVEGAVRQGASWSAPVRLSEAGTDAQRTGQLDVAGDGHGDFVTVWGQYDESSGLYAVDAEEVRAGTWQGAQELAASPDFLDVPSVAENATGAATALWVDYESSQVESASLREGQWTPLPIEGSTDTAYCGLPQPQVGVDAAGVSTAAWANRTGGLFTDTLPAGGRWSDVSRLADLPEGTIVYQPAMVVNPAGAAALSWERWDTETNSWGVEASYRPAGGSWEQPASLAAPTEGVAAPSISMDATGDALTSWGAGPYGSTVNLLYAYVQAPSANATSEPQASSSPTMLPSPTTLSSPPKADGAPALGPVYLEVPHSRLRLARHSQVLHVRIRNRNAFPVSGTATIGYYLLPSKGAHDAKAAPAAERLAVASVAHFDLAANAEGRLSFRLSARALRRLFADVPDSGHDLVSIHLSVAAAGGQRSSGSSVYALDAPARRAAPHRSVPSVPPGYRAPVDPWVKAHAAC
jgi:hypothetical protein